MTNPEQMTMVERVAHELWLRIMDRSDIDQADCLDFARAALSALREPTEGMMAVAEEATWEPSSDRPYIDYFTLKLAWQAAIDAALTEGKADD